MINKEHIINYVKSVRSELKKEDTKNMLINCTISALIHSFAIMLSSFMLALYPRAICPVSVIVFILILIEHILFIKI